MFYAEDRQRLAPGGGQDNAKTVVPQNRLQQRAHVGLIIDDKNAGAGTIRHVVSRYSGARNG